MIAAAAICGSISYVTIEKLEHDLAEQTYYSVASSALKGSKAATRRKIQACQVMATILSHHFPKASQWPFVALPGFTDLSTQMLEFSAAPLSLTPMVRPPQVAAFEAFAAQVYRDQGYPEDAGYSEFGFGIWRRDFAASPYADGRIHDTMGNTTLGSAYPSVLWPMLLNTNTSSQGLMYNMHSEGGGMMCIDAMIECSFAAVDAADGRENATMISPDNPPNCAAVSGFLELKTRPGPAAVVHQPIYPAQDPTILVGLSGAPISWEDVLIDVVPDSVDGLYCVISTETESYTFIMRHGIPSLLGHGDFHDPSFNKYGRSAVITDVDIIGAESPSYTLTVYPSGQMFEDNTSCFIAFGFVIVIFICTCIFLVYDFLMRNESRQNKVILEVKRRFVRFISHEIRTPLNTVCLGLELLQSELSGQIGANALAAATDNDVDAMQRSTEASLRSYWSGLVDDIFENAKNAIGILNDLLNYDKMEQGTFKLEVGPVRIWELIQRTVASFDIQAKKRAILLDTRIDHDGRTMQDLGCLQVLGDDVRLRQVIRNIISNSLKFSPENTGAVKVTMQYSPYGLPNALLLRANLARENMSNDLACEYPRAGAIQVLVQDNGVGMTQDQLRRLFQEGVQFEPNTIQVSVLINPVVP
jgi:signal transduction histidine kinase